MFHVQSNFSSTMRRPIRTKQRLSVVSMQSASTVSSEEGPDFPAASNGHTRKTSTASCPVEFSRQASLEIRDIMGSDESSEEDEDDLSRRDSEITLIEQAQSLSPSTNPSLQEIPE